MEVGGYPSTPPWSLQSSSGFASKASIFGDILEIIYITSVLLLNLSQKVFFFWTCRSLEGEDCSLFGVGFSSSPVPGKFLFVLREEKAIREFAIILQPLRCMLVAFTVVLSCDFIWVTPLFPLKLLMCHPFFWPFWLAALNQV